MYFTPVPQTLKYLLITYILPAFRTIAHMALVVEFLTKFMLITATDFDTGIILGKMHCSRNFIVI